MKRWFRWLLSMSILLECHIQLTVRAVLISRVNSRRDLIWLLGTIFTLTEMTLIRTKRLHTAQCITSRIISQPSNGRCTSLESSNPMVSSQLRLAQSCWTQASTNSARQTIATVGEKDVVIDLITYLTISDREMVGSNSVMQNQKLKRSSYEFTLDSFMWR
jgi:hypothetical protein